MPVTELLVGQVFRLGAVISRNWRSLCQWFWELVRDPARGNRFLVLVCDFEHDTKRRHKEHVLSALRRRGVPFRLRSVELKPPIQVEDSIEEEEHLVRRGQRLLEHENADLLICGSVAADNRSLRLQFIGRQGPEDLHRRPFLLDLGELSDEFHEVFETTLVAASIANIRSHGEKQLRQWMQDMLQSEKKLCDLVARDRRPFAWTNKRTLRLVIAWIRYRIGTLVGDNQLLESAVAMLTEVIDSTDKSQRPLEWAEVQNNLGIVLSQLGERKSDGETLDLAIGAFRSSQEKYTLQDSNLEWAAAQHNVGVNLVKMGELGGGSDLISAVVRFV